LQSLCLIPQKTRQLPKENMSTQGLQGEDPDESQFPQLALAAQLEQNSGLSRFTCGINHKHAEGGECLGTLLTPESTAVEYQMKGMNADGWVSSLNPPDHHLSGGG
jgi:hypothetical protein